MFPAHRAITDPERQLGSRRGGIPRIPAIGGGTGLPNVLRGLRPLLYGGSEHSEVTPSRDRLVAIVATSDDGGSSGRLHAQFNVVPPVGVPLVSEHPAGKVRHHPDRLAAAILAIAQRKLGAWRGRVEAGGN